MCGNSREDGKIPINGAYSSSEKLVFTVSTKKQIMLQIYSEPLKVIMSSFIKYAYNVKSCVDVRFMLYR